MMSIFQFRGQVNLRDAIIHLSNNNQAIQALKMELSSDKIDDAIKAMTTGDLDSEIGAEVHDFFIDAIVNDAEPVWEGVIEGSDDEYPVLVCEYYGVFFVDVVDGDRIRYFLSMNQAVEAIKFNWRGLVKENN